MTGPRDPHLDARAKAFLEGRPRQIHTEAGVVNQYADRSPGKLAEDVNRLTDLLVDLVRERDGLRDALTKALRRVDSVSLKFWIVGGLVVGEGCVIGWFATELFSRLK